MKSVFRWMSFAVSTICFVWIALGWALYANFYTAQQVLPYAWIVRLFFYAFVFRVAMGFWWLFVRKEPVRRRSMIFGIGVYAVILVACLAAMSGIAIGRALDWNGLLNVLDANGIFPWPIVGAGAICMSCLMVECSLKLSILKSNVASWNASEKFVISRSDDWR